MKIVVHTVMAMTVGALLIAAATAAALGQVPPHEPGSICATPTFWCWAQPYGTYGEPCSCPTAAGYVQGTYI